MSEEVRPMQQVTALQIEGFRRLGAIGLELRPLMVMLGANGVGKTSVLDAIALISHSATGELSRCLSDLGGIADVLTRGRSENLSLGLSIEGPDSYILDYRFSIAPKGTGYSIANEVLIQSPAKNSPALKHINSQDTNIRYLDAETGTIHRPEWEHDPQETSLSQVPKMYRQPEELRRLLGSVARYHVLDVGRRAPVKLPQQLKPATGPGANGEDLISFLFSLRESHRDRFEAIEDTLKVAFPGFEGLQFPPVAAGMLSLTWRERHFREPIYIHQLSEGTLRFLWLVSILQSPQPATITMIDEPEVSLHPELIALLADLLREASKKTQILVATHSDRLVRFLEPHEVAVMDLDDNGLSTVAWADALDLDDWLKEYTLDELWRAGRMGARS
jgi:predicted ATPase